MESPTTKPNGKSHSGSTGRTTEVQVAELIESAVAQHDTTASAERQTSSLSFAADDNQAVVTKKEDPLFPTMPTDKFAYIGARGNGSCGPNSLAIIFCSYLLSGRYNQSYFDRTTREIKAGDLREFAACWNLYYANNEESHADYIKITTSFPPSVEELLTLNHAILEKVQSKLDGYAEKYQGHSFKHCEALIAPVLRFAFNVNTELDKRSFAHYSLGYFLYLFGSKDDVHEKEYQVAMEVSERVKIDMSMEKTITRKHARNLRNMDNSPSYRSFFNENGVDYSANLLRLSCLFARVNNRAYQWPEMLFDTEDLNTWYTNPPLCFNAIVFNRNQLHFDACLPISVCEDPLVKLFYDDSLKPIEQQARYPEDGDVYNPANLDDSTRFPQRLTPSSASSVSTKPQHNSSFSYRFLISSGYFAISALAAISIFYAPITSIISLLILIPSYLYRDNIKKMFKRGQEFTVSNLTNRPASSSWYKKIRLGSITHPFQGITCLQRTRTVKPRSA